VEDINDQVIESVNIGSNLYISMKMHKYVFLVVQAHMEIKSFLYKNTIFLKLIIEPSSSKARSNDHLTVSHSRLRQVSFHSPSCPARL
jgi:hypothetical protein